VAAVGDQDVGRAVRRSAEGAQRKPTPKQGMGRVGDLDLGHLIGGWVIEGGRKL